MAASASSLAGLGAEQGSSPSLPPGSPSVLAGGDIPEPGMAGVESADEGLRMVVNQMRDMQATMMDLAKQFPAAAPSLRNAATGLRAALRQIISNPGSPEPPAPAIGG